MVNLQHDASKCRGDNITTIMRALPKYLYLERIFDVGHFPKEPAIILKLVKLNWSPRINAEASFQ